MRLFIAIDLPEDVKQVIEEIKTSIDNIKGVKPVNKQNLHLTMKFLGEVDDNKAGKVTEALSKIEFKPLQNIESKLYRLGSQFFQNSRMPFQGLEE